MFTIIFDNASAMYEVVTISEAKKRKAQYAHIYPTEKAAEKALRQSRRARKEVCYGKR